MKTAILQLEPYDNRFSICDKMEWNHVNRVLIVWPKRAKNILDQQDLIYIKRQTQNLGLQLALVCREDRIIAWAAGLSISTFASVPIAESSHWQSSHPQFMKNEEVEFLTELQQKVSSGSEISDHPTLRIFSRVLSVLLGAGALVTLLVFLIPSATVTLYPQTHEKQITVDVWASPQFHEVNLNGNLPAFEKQVEVSGNIQGVSSGTTGIPNTAAAGMVTLTNLTNDAVVLSKGTVISTSIDPVVRYSLDQDVNIPAGAGSTVSASVTALQAGSAGNQPVDALTVVEGALGAEVNVTNEAPISGGQDEQSLSPKEADYTKLQIQLLGQLRSQATAQMESAGEQLIENTLDNGEVTSSVRSLDPGQPGEQISLTLTVRFTGLVYAQKDLDTLLDGALTASLASNEVNYSGRFQSTHEKLIEVSTDGEDAKWQQVVTAQVGPAVNTASLAQALAGKSRSDSITLIQADLPSSHLPQITIYPFNRLQLPFAAYRIQIQVHP